MEKSKIIRFLLINCKKICTFANKLVLNKTKIE